MLTPYWRERRGKMKKSISTLLALITINFAFAIECVDFSKVNFIFLDKTKGSVILNTEDDFTNNLSEFDMSARLKTSKKVSKEEYLNFISQQALDWSEEEKFYLNVAFSEIKDLFQKYEILIPKEINLIKTTGAEEGNSAYCRNQNTIVFAKDMIQMNDLYAMKELLIHELFHIFSKNNLDIRERLYNSIGFYKTKNLLFPQNLAKYKITNPDSVNNNYYFESTINGSKEKIMPILVASGDYDEEKGGEFFNYLQLAFCSIEETENTSQIKIINNKYCIFPLKMIPNYISLIGENTNYIIHTEEVLADNFVLLVTNSKNVKTETVISNMRNILKK